MRITSCVPLAGHGVIARYGPLVAVTDGLGPGPDLLLSAVAETAGRAGDGTGLVIKAARAALVLDDGTRVTLDGDYVLGREPALDGEVMAGRARPLRVNDPNGTVSRLHLKVSLVGWQVEVSDLGSANGSVLQSPGGERTLTPFEPAVIEPGARIEIGHRSMHYVVDQGA